MASSSLHRGSTYTHDWYTETARDLSPEAVEQAVAWRRAWHEARSSDGRPSALGRLSLKEVRATHERMRDARDKLELRNQLYRAVFLGIVLYYIGQFVLRRIKRWVDSLPAGTTPGTSAAAGAAPPARQAQGAEAESHRKHKKKSKAA